MEHDAIVVICNLLVSCGAGFIIVKWVNAKMPVVDVHTKSALLNKILDTIGNAAESLVKSVLNGNDIDALISGFAAGESPAALMAGLLPDLLKSLNAAIGPVLSTALSELLGGDQKANDTMSQAILAVVHDIVGLLGVHKPAVGGQIVHLPSGHLLVVPAGQPVPDGCKVVSAGFKKAA